MQILTDILSLLKRKQIIKDATPEDVVVLGRHEEPDMLGIASPIPYKSVKLIKVKDLLEANDCIYTNVVNGTGTTPARIFRDKTSDPCSINLRTISAIGNNIVITENANEIEISTSGEPNTAANVGTGAGVWKDKLGETLRFKSITAGSGITITESANEIEIQCDNRGSGQTLTAGDLINITSDEINHDVVNLTIHNPSTIQMNYGQDLPRKLVGSNVTFDGFGHITNYWAEQLKMPNWLGLTDVSLDGTNLSFTSTAGSQGGFEGIVDLSSLAGASNVYDLQQASGPFGVGFGLVETTGLTIVDQVFFNAGTNMTINQTVGPAGELVHTFDAASSLPYTSYVQLLTQLANINPTGPVLENSAGISITWTYNGTGSYNATFASPLANIDKVTIDIAQTFKSTTASATITNASVNGFELNITDCAKCDRMDSQLQRSKLEIRVYP